MKVRLLVLFAIALATALVFAQATQTERAKRSGEIMKKVRQMDLMNQLLPLLMTKAQIDKFLPEVERARASLRKLESAEYDTLVKLEPKIDAALKEGYEKQKVVEREVMQESYGTFKLMTARRIAASNEAASRILEIAGKELNKGQKKSMAGALRPSVVNPDVDPAKLSEEDRMEFFVQAILLDPECYDVLLKIREKAD